MSIYIRNCRVCLKMINNIYSQKLFFIIDRRDKWRSFKRWRFSSNILETTLGRKSFVKNSDIYLYTVTLFFYGCYYNFLLLIINTALYNQV